MAIDVLDKLRKLIALSASDNEHEAALAAVSACALLRKHEVTFALPGQPSPGNLDAAVWDDIFGKKKRQKAASAAQEQPAKSDAQSDIHNEQEQARAWEQECREAEERAKEAEIRATSNPAPDTDEHDYKRYFVIKQEYQIRPAKFRGRCARCGRDIRIGMTIAWKGGRLIDAECAVHEGVIGAYKIS